MAKAADPKRYDRQLEAERRYAKKRTDTSMSARFSEEWTARIDTVRGDASRGTFIREAVEREVERREKKG